MPNKISKIERRNYIMANKEVMNEEVKMNEEAATEVVEVKEESKIKKIFNKIKKPLTYAAVLAVGIGAGLVIANTKTDSEDVVVEETATEE